jgi:hypothetical protein
MYLELYANAFLELDTERKYDNGPIPWSSIALYCHAYDFSEDQTEMAFPLIRIVDNVIRAKRAKEQAASGEKDAPTTRR